MVPFSGINGAIEILLLASVGRPTDVFFCIFESYCGSCEWSFGDCVNDTTCSYPGSGVLCERCHGKQTPKSEERTTQWEWQETRPAGIGANVHHNLKF